MSIQTPPPRITRRHAILLLASGATGLAASHASVLKTRWYAAMTSPFSFGIDIHSQGVYSLVDAHTQLVAAVFVATDCPISNRYLPEIAHLSRQFSPHGVRFWLVYPNPADDLAAVRAHQAQYPDAAALSQLIAPDPRFIRQAHVHVTPEAALFSSAWPMSTPPLWHGRIDNRYLTFGTQRPAATQHDLANAIDAALQGQPLTPPAAPPVGCAIIPRDLHT